MKALAKIGPFGFTNLVFNHLFGEILDDDIMVPSSRDIPYNVAKKDTGYELEFNVAGYDKDKLKIDVDDNQLIVSYEDKQTTEKISEDYVYKSFNKRSFKKTFNLTDIDISAIKAKHEDGILRIILPKDKDKVSRTIMIE